MDPATDSSDNAHSLAMYDPNIHWARHTVEITYMQWDYRCTVLIEILGNCRGATLFSSAIARHAEQLYEQSGEDAELIMTRPAEDGDGVGSLIETPDDGHFEDWLTDLCVRCRFVKHEKESRS